MYSQVFIQWTEERLWRPVRPIRDGGQYRSNAHRSMAQTPEIPFSPDSSRVSFRYLHCQGSVRRRPPKEADLTNRQEHSPRNHPTQQGSKQGGEQEYTILPAQLRHEVLCCQWRHLFPFATRFVNKRASQSRDVSKQRDRRVSLQDDDLNMGTPVRSMQLQARQSVQNRKCRCQRNNRHIQALSFAGVKQTDGG